MYFLCWDKCAVKPLYRDRKGIFTAHLRSKWVCVCVAFDVKWVCRPCSKACWLVSLMMVLWCPWNSQTCKSVASIHLIKKMEEDGPELHRAPFILDCFKALSMNQGALTLTHHNAALSGASCASPSCKRRHWASVVPAAALSVPDGSQSCFCRHVKSSWTLEGWWWDSSEEVLSSLFPPLFTFTSTQWSGLCMTDNLRKDCSLV